MLRFVTAQRSTNIRQTAARCVQIIIASFQCDQSKNDTQILSMISSLIVHQFSILFHPHTLRTICDKNFTKDPIDRRHI